MGIIDRGAIIATEPVIRPYIRRTPVITVAAKELGLAVDTEITLKLELMQHTGSFKARGAFANLLLRPIPAVGVAAVSGGNHGVAVAYAAKRFGVPARIFVPAIASPAKVARIREYGAELVITGERVADAFAAGEDWVERSGALFVHPFNQRETVLGQGTVALELAEQAPGLDILLVPVGGGGLIAGIAAFHAGAVKAIGVEPEKAPTLTRALAAGRPVDTETGGIAADSLAPPRIGEQVFPIIKAHVAEALLVSEEAIRAAQQALWEALRIVVEPGGAAALAALLSGAHRPAPGERVGVVLSGGNTTAVDFTR